MKKHLLLITLFLMSCKTPKYTIFKSMNSDTENYISEEYIDDESFYVEKKDKNHVLYKTGDKEILYYADYIIDDEYYYNDNIYQNNNRDQIGFLVINNGKLYFNGTTFLKEGDAYEPRNSMQYGKNALVTLIGDAYVSFNKCAINIFSKGSSTLHLMNGAKAIMKSVDVVITDEYSCVCSYYNNNCYVESNDCFIFIDNEKSEESVIFYDD